MVNSICHGLFNRNCELYVEDEFDSNGVLIYKPPLLHEVWLNEAGSHKGKEVLLQQRCRNEDLMHAQHQVTCERAGPTPGLTPPVAGSFPDAVAISDDDSVDLQRESLGMIMMMTGLLTFPSLLLLQIL